MLDRYPLIKRLHQETLRPMDIPWDEKDWPDSWKYVEFKEYPRLPQVVLPEPERLHARTEAVLQGRMSRRNFDPAATLSLKKLSTLLHWSAGISRNREKPEQSFRFYPSGGARYPLELYLALRGNVEVETGVYHYNVKKHALERLLGEEGEQALRGIPNYPFIKDAAVVVYVGAIFERNMRKYRERGYRFVVMEAGILLHNFFMVSGAMGLGMCPSGAIVEERVEEILDVREGECLLSHFAVGPTRAAAEQAAAL